MTGTLEQPVQVDYESDNDKIKVEHVICAMGTFPVRWIFDKRH